MASAPVVLTGLDRPAFFKSGRLSTAQILWLAFVTVQALDGAMSYVGRVAAWPWTSKPILSSAWYLAAFGPAVGFTAAKLFAVTCGAVLYMTARHRWVAFLTLVYLVFAVGPWVRLLSGHACRSRTIADRLTLPAATSG